MTQNKVVFKEQGGRIEINICPKCKTSKRFYTNDKKGEGEGLSYF